MVEVVVLAACAGCGSRGLHAQAIAPAQPMILAIDDSAAAAATDPRAQTLMHWVRALEKEAHTACSATYIGPRALLTAAHCVDGTDPAVPAGAATIPLDRRACAHGRFDSCAEPFPVGDYNQFQDDVATVWLDADAGLVNMPKLGRLGAYGAVPGAFMLSARSGQPHPVCNAQASGEVGTADGWVERGDSGSAIVALRADNEPVILGVVSHRWESRGRWYFAVIPNALPWPTAATTDAPPIEHYYDNDFSPIQDCQ
jgi:hypothetical protein